MFVPCLAPEDSLIADCVASPYLVGFFGPAADDGDGRLAAVAPGLLGTAPTPIGAGAVERDLPHFGQNATSEPTSVPQPEQNGIAPSFVSQLVSNPRKLLLATENRFEFLDKDAIEEFRADSDPRAKLTTERRGKYWAGL